MPSIEGEFRLLDAGFKGVDHAKSGLQEDFVFIGAERFHQRKQRLAHDPGRILLFQWGTLFGKSLTGDEAVTIHLKKEPVRRGQRGALISLGPKVAVQKVQSLGSTRRRRDRERLSSRDVFVQCRLALTSYRIPDRAPVAALLLIHLEKADTIGEKPGSAAQRIITGLEEASHQAAGRKSRIHRLTREVPIAGLPGSYSVPEQQTVRALLLDDVIRHQNRFGLIAQPLQER
jgi:hypothetical protein